MNYSGFCTILSFGSLGGLMVSLMLFALWRYVKKQSRDKEQSRTTLLHRLQVTYPKQPLSFPFEISKND